MELPPKVYDQILRHSEKGNALMDSEQYESAIIEFQKALELLPNPQNDWEAAVWLHGSIGDALYQTENFEDAVASLFDALNAPDGQANPFIQLRLGESFFCLGDLKSAKEHLTQAYMLGGAELFEDEPAEYLDIVEKK